MHLLSIYTINAIWIPNHIPYWKRLSSFALGTQHLISFIGISTDSTYNHINTPTIPPLYSCLKWMQYVGSQKWTLRYHSITSMSILTSYVVFVDILCFIVLFPEDCNNKITELFHKQTNANKELGYWILTLDHTVKWSCENQSWYETRQL